VLSRLAFKPFIFLHAINFYTSYYQQYYDDDGEKIRQLLNCGSGGE